MWTALWTLGQDHLHREALSVGQLLGLLHILLPCSPILPELRAAQGWASAVALGTVDLVQQLLGLELPHQYRLQLSRALCRPHTASASL